MRTRESEEMYLETILILKKQSPNVRSIDVADELQYAKSSVSRAIGLLVRKGYIVIGSGGIINFTAEGKAKAENIYERHRVLTSALMKMGADKELAETNACRIEHVISQELMEIIRNFAADLGDK